MAGIHGQTYRKVNSDDSNVSPQETGKNMVMFEPASDGLFSESQSEREETV